MDQEAVNDIKDHIDKRFNELQPKLIPIPELCDIIGISKATFYNWQKSEPVFTVVQYRGTKRVPRQSLMEFLQNHKTNGKY